MAFFYTHLIEIELVAVELDKLDLTEEEKSHLAHLVDSSLHHTVIDAVLSELNQQDKKAFLQHLHQNDHSKVWEFLNQKVDKVEDKIKKAADDLTYELHKDLKEAKRNG